MKPNRITRILRPLQRPPVSPSQWLAASWLLAGSLFWVFLTAPYILETKECVWPEKNSSTDIRAQPENGRIECLKPVARQLRRDSNIAVYATATVAALIAFQTALTQRRQPEQWQQRLVRRGRRQSRRQPRRNWPRTNLSTHHHRTRRPSSPLRPPYQLQRRHHLPGQQRYAPRYGNRHHHVAKNPQADSVGNHRSHRRPQTPLRWPASQCSAPL